MTDTTAHPAKMTAPQAAPAEPDQCVVMRDDANNYSKILSALGMEEEGDPVQAVCDLIAADDARQEAKAFAAPADPNIYEQRLRSVLAAIQRYLPPDGAGAQDTLSEIIGIVDPWPVGAAPAEPVAPEAEIRPDPEGGNYVHWLRPGEEEE